MLLLAYRFELSPGWTPLTAEPVEQLSVVECHSQFVHDIHEVAAKEQAPRKAVRAWSVENPPSAPVGLLDRVEPAQLGLVRAKERDRVCNQLVEEREHTRVTVASQDEEDVELLAEAQQVGIERTNPLQILPVHPSHIVVRSRDDHVVEVLTCHSHGTQDVGRDHVSLVLREGSHAAVEHLEHMWPLDALREHFTEPLHCRMDAGVLILPGFLGGLRTPTGSFRARRTSDQLASLDLVQAFDCEVPDRAGHEQVRQAFHRNDRARAQQIVLEHEARALFSCSHSQLLVAGALGLFQQLDDRPQHGRGELGARTQETLLDHPVQQPPGLLERRVLFHKLVRLLIQAELAVLGRRLHDQLVQRVGVEANHAKVHVDRAQARVQVVQVPREHLLDLCLITQDVEPLALTRNARERVVRLGLIDGLRVHRLHVAVGVGVVVVSNQVRARLRDQGPMEPVHDRTVCRHKCRVGYFRGVHSLEVVRALLGVGARLEAHRHSRAKRRIALGLGDEDVVRSVERVRLAIYATYTVDADEAESVRHIHHDTLQNFMF